MPPEQATAPERSYCVWRAYGETMIVQGTEPVWLALGEMAEKVSELQAEDYESACDKWNQQVHAEAAKGYQASGDGKQFESDIGSVVKPA